MGWIGLGLGVQSRCGFIVFIHSSVTSGLVASSDVSMMQGECVFACVGVLIGCVCGLVWFVFGCKKPLRFDCFNEFPCNKWLGWPQGCIYDAG